MSEQMPDLTDAAQVDAELIARITKRAEHDEREKEDLTEVIRANRARIAELTAALNTSQGERKEYLRACKHLKAQAALVPKLVEALENIRDLKPAPMDWRARQIAISAIAKATAQ